MKNYQRWEGFPLKVTAEKTGKLEYELLQMAAAGKLELWYWPDNYLWIWANSMTEVADVEKDWLKIESHVVIQLLENESVLCTSFKNTNGVEVKPGSIKNRPYSAVVQIKSKWMGTTAARHEQNNTIGYNECDIDITIKDLHVLPPGLDVISGNFSKKNRENSKELGTNKDTEKKPREMWLKKDIANRLGLQYLNA